MGHSSLSLTSTYEIVEYGLKKLFSEEAQAVLWAQLAEFMF
jgi:hypothetical protein